MPAKIKPRDPSAAGRPPKSPGGRQVKVAIAISPEYADALRVFGGGILGAGVRMAATEKALELLGKQAGK